MRNGQTSKSNIASAALLPSDLLPDRFLVLRVHKFLYLYISTAKSNDERFLQRTPTANPKKTPLHNGVLPQDGRLVLLGADGQKLKAPRYEGLMFLLHTKPNATKMRQLNENAERRRISTDSHRSGTSAPEAG